MSPLTFLTRILPDLAEALNYPGEARYLALLLGLSGEIWFDDGSYTGLARFTLQDLLVRASIANYAPLFQRGQGIPEYWLLLDQESHNLFIGESKVVTAYLEHNTTVAFTT